MAEESLSTVNRGLIDAEERERTRIANGLHDDISQRVALLQFKVEQLRADVPNPRVEVLATLDELLKQIELLSTDIQGSAHNLHSPKLEYLGLVSTMKSFCKEFAQQQKMEVHFNSKDMPSPPPSLDLALNPEEAMKGAGLGLISMQARMKLVQGEFSIESQPKHGTTIHAKVSAKRTGFLQTPA